MHGRRGRKNVQAKHRQRASRFVRDCREKLGISQRKFGLICGVTSQTVGNWETGRSAMPLDLIFLLKAYVARREIGWVELFFFGIEFPEKPKRVVRKKDTKSHQAGRIRTKAGRRAGRAERP